MFATRALAELLQVRKEGPRHARDTGHIAIESFIEPFRINTLEGFIALAGKYCGIVHQQIEGLAVSKNPSRLRNCRLVANVQ